MPVLKIPAKATDFITKSYGDQLFDLMTDPDEEKPVGNEKEKDRLTEEMKKLMEESNAPIELFQRLGLK